jgi:hypothetical protein
MVALRSHYKKPIDWMSTILARIGRNTTSFEARGAQFAQQALDWRPMPPPHHELRDEFWARRNQTPKWLICPFEFKNAAHFLDRHVPADVRAEFLAEFLAESQSLAEFIVSRGHRRNILFLNNQKKIKK